MSVESCSNFAVTLKIIKSRDIPLGTPTAELMVQVDGDRFKLQK